MIYSFECSIFCEQRTFCSADKGRAGMGKICCTIRTCTVSDLYARLYGHRNGSYCEMICHSSRSCIWAVHGFQGDVF